MAAMFDEFRQAWRGVSRRPGFLLVATLTLALGIAASVSVVSLIDRVLLRPLPFVEPGQLVVLGIEQPGGRSTITPQEYRAVETIDGIASIGIASMQTVPVNIAEAGDPELVQAYTADAGFLRTLSPAMRLGRNFTADEDMPNGARGVILSHGMWQRRFNGDKRVIGRTLAVEGVETPIVGVLPKAFRYIGPFDLILPMRLPADSRDNGRNHMAVARLSDDLTAASLSPLVNARIHNLYTGTYAARYYVATRFGAQSLSTAIHADARPVLSLFLASAFCVLLLATTNLVNLMLLRSLSRSHVSAVRSALGASKWRLAMPMLAEGLLVGFVGAAAGLALAAAGLRIAGGRIPVSWFGGAADLSFGASAYVFAFSAALLVAVLAAVLGVWRGRAGTDARELVAAGRSGLGLGSGRLARLLVVAQVALACLLLMAAALFARSLQDTGKVDLGYRTDGLLGFEIAPVQSLYPDAASVKALVARAVDRLERMPGVEAVAGGTNLPIGAPLNLPVTVPGHEPTSVEFRGVTPGFFEGFGIARRSGRDLQASDTAQDAATVVVNEAFVRHHLDGDADVLDRIIHLAMGDPVPLRIVGVVGDTRQLGPEQGTPPMVYLPFAQMPDEIVTLLRDFMPLRFALRVNGDPAPYATALREALAEVAPGQPVANIKPLDALVRESTDGTRLNLMLIGTFAGLALLLSAVGLYAVVAVATSARQREFGVRAALGAKSTSLLTLVLGDGLRQAAWGLAIALIGSLALSRVLQAYVAGVSTTDPLAFALVVVVLGLVAAIACLTPALRAARVSPMRALRDE